MDRARLAELWHRRGQIPREQIFGPHAAKLIPTAVPRQAQIAVPGMVGPDYVSGGLVIVSVNPAGGRDGFTPTAGDDQLYSDALHVQQSADVCAFEQLNQAFLRGMPHWGPQWRIIESILRATRHQLSEIAYPYLVPYRTRGDAGSKLPPAILEQGYQTGFREIMVALSPRHVVAVDRPSERACLRLLSESQLDFQLTYLTRKRDAHFERASTLQSLATRFAMYRSWS